jgi:aminopeptidase N
MNLATWLIDRGELESAVEVLRAVVADASETVLAPDEPVEATAHALQEAQRSLATTLRDLGRHQESVPVLRALLAGRLSAVPRDEALVDDARSLLLAALLRTGDHEGAKAVGQLHLGARVERLGMKDPWTVLAAVQLGAAEHGLGTPDARRSMETFMQELRVTVGHTDERTLHARILVQAALAREDPSVASELIAEFAEENLADCLRLLGSRHHLTADARRAAGE